MLARYRRTHIVISFLAPLLLSPRSRVFAFRPSTHLTTSFSSVASSRFASPAPIPTLDMSVSPKVIPGRPTWQQTMIRIKDPSKSIPFYTDLLGFSLIDKFDFPQYSFTVYFLTTLPAGEQYTLTPGTQEAHEYLWSSDAVMLELTHNHGTENDSSQAYHAGNQEKDGFGHIAVK